MLKRAAYASRNKKFFLEPNESILGKLTAASSFSVELAQKEAWLEQVSILKKQLTDFPEGHIFLEFNIPRMGKRADVILILEDIVFVIEFKVGSSSFHSADRAQTIDYALDLKNFHEGSHDAIIVPILVATLSKASSNSISEISAEYVINTLCCNSHGLADTIKKCLGAACTKTSTHSYIDVNNWLESSYKPTPTIIEAARALYNKHDVSEISRSDAGAKNLSETATEIGRIIKEAKANSHKAICFVTGVPGAGKTLAGLSVTTSQMNHTEDEHAVFLSGNGPLVKVLRTALARDYKSRNNVTMEEAKRKTNAFIQNIHHFRDDSLANIEAPADKVVVFDEAQRAWDHHHTVKFMRQKKRLSDFDSSEPEFLIEVLDRHEDWCVIIALIGGGQELNSGEAGISEWLKALRKRFINWKVYHSNLMSSEEYAGSLDFTALSKGLDSYPKEQLHLGVSVRSFRTERLSEFVHHLIGNDACKANSCYSHIKNKYPIYLTRNINTARIWLREKAQGSELYGLTASSGARRLRPEGLEVKRELEPDIWFLNGPKDVRSCQYLEQVATEFDIQGLELDWAAVCWDADLRRDKEKWEYRQFKGTRWQNINKPVDQQYLLNAYRVLLTRARQGMIIYVPLGDEKDVTRKPEFYQPIAEFLTAAGISTI